MMWARIITAARNPLSRQQTVGARTGFNVPPAYRPTSPPIGTKRPKPVVVRSVTRFRMWAFFNAGLTDDDLLCGAADRDTT